MYKTPVRLSILTSRNIRAGVDVSYATGEASRYFAIFKIAVNLYLYELGLNWSF